MFKIATWNVNSLRVRLPQVLEWISTEKPDVLALQETKLQDLDFPVDEINQAGYEVVFSGQKAYNGVAILSSTRLSDIVTDFPGWQDPQRRVLAATVGDVRIVNIYIPNGESPESEKFQYKLNWLDQLSLFLKQQLEQYKKLIVLGDFNIAPEDSDVCDPKAWEGCVLVSEKERAAFQEIVQVGFKDCFRLFSQPEKSFSWWDYRMNAFKRNRGLRIDHILASDAQAVYCEKGYIDVTLRKHERPSDHTIVVAEFGRVPVA